jgi:hypothetical protein
MLVAEPDRSFANRGAVWSGVPYLWVDSGFGPRDDDQIHYVGGTVTGVHLLSTGSVCAVVWSRDYDPYLPNPNAISVRLVTYAPGDGRPKLGWDEAAAGKISEAEQFAEPLASCSRADGGVSILIRQRPIEGAPGPWAYSLCTPGSLGGVTRQPLDPSLFFDRTGLVPRSGNLRMAADAGDIVIASTGGKRLRLARIGASGNTAHTVDLDNNGNQLPGLQWLEVAGLRFEAGTAIVALTAHLNHPGAASMAAVTRLRPDGSRDPGFANAGLWSSPISNVHRDFVCAGEFGGFVAGRVGQRAVVFALDAANSSGDGLDMRFGGGAGFVEHDLGGPLGSTVAVADSDAVYVFAQRASSHSNASADLQTVGCRVTTSSTSFGVVDPGFGTGGTASVYSDGLSFEPTGLVRSGAHLFVGGTRTLHGIDCDRIPVVVASDPATGEPDEDFGFGGLALHAGVQYPGCILPDGTSILAERSNASKPALRFIAPNGELGERVPLAALPDGALIRSITPLSDGSLVVAGPSTTVAGSTTPAWLIKLAPNRSIDATFGTNGVFHPKPDAEQVTVVGVRSDGKLVLRLSDGRWKLAVMLPAGGLEPAFGTNAFADLDGFTHFAGTGYGSAVTCFLDENDAVICVAHTDHPASSSPFVTVGLRRITPAGNYDAGFGLGAPSVLTPSSSLYLTLITPGGHGLEYGGVSPKGVWWVGGKLYVVALAYAGGYFSGNFVRPRYPFLVVMRWNSDGSKDVTWFNGKQEAGLAPRERYWIPAGVLQYSATSLLIYGTACPLDRVEITAGGMTYTNLLIGPPRPALFKLDDPAGLDLSFGEEGATIYRSWEPVLTAVAGALLDQERVRAAYVDVLTWPSSTRPQSNFASLIQWKLTDRVLPFSEIRPKGSQLQRALFFLLLGLAVISLLWTLTR